VLTSADIGRYARTKRSAHGRVMNVDQNVLRRD
jgi:hypothetical protein